MESLVNFIRISFPAERFISIRVLEPHTDTAVIHFYSFSVQCVWSFDSHTDTGTHWITCHWTWKEERSGREKFRVKAMLCAMALLGQEKVLWGSFMKASRNKIDSNKATSPHIKACPMSGEGKTSQTRNKTCSRNRTVLRSTLIASTTFCVHLSTLYFASFLLSHSHFSFLFSFPLSFGSLCVARHTSEQKSIFSSGSYYHPILFPSFSIPRTHFHFVLHWLIYWNGK